MLAGWAKFALPEPAEIDFGRLAELSTCANFSVREIEVVVPGEATKDNEAWRVAATGQVFAVSGAIGGSPTGFLAAAVVGWPDGPIVLENARYR